MIVELDLHSGRPNPRWQLGGDAETTFHALVASLAPAPGPPDSPPDLGYRGFVVTDADQAYRVFGGRVATGTMVLSDSGRTLERWLLAGLPRRHEALRAAVTQALRSS